MSITETELKLDKLATHLREQVANRESLTDLQGNRINLLSWNGGEANYPDGDDPSVDFYPNSLLGTVTIYVQIDGDWHNEEEWPTAKVATLNEEEAREYFKSLT